MALEGLLVLAVPLVPAPQVAPLPLSCPEDLVLLEDQAVHLVQVNQQNLVPLLLQEDQPFLQIPVSPWSQGCQVHLADPLTLVGPVDPEYPVLLVALVSQRHLSPLSLPFDQAGQMVLEILCPPLALWAQEDLKVRKYDDIYNKILGC